MDRRGFFGFLARSAASVGVALGVCKPAASEPGWQSMNKGVFFGDPTNPDSGGFVFFENGVAKWRSLSGTIRNIPDMLPRVCFFCSKGFHEGCGGTVIVNQSVCDEQDLTVCKCRCRWSNCGLKVQEDCSGHIGCTKDKCVWR